jgi:hypothetical protein
MIPPIYFGLACLAMVALHYLLPLTQLLTWPWRFSGVVLILGGIGLAIAASGSSNVPARRSVRSSP